MAGPRAAKDSDLEFLPGIVSNAADRDAMGRWTDANYVRWHLGLAEKIGGSVRQALTGSNGGVYLGQGRTIMDWSSLDGQKWIAIGTHAKLYVVNSGTLYDITPIRKTSAATNPIATSSGSAVVTITDADHRAEPGNYVNIFSAAAVGGLTLSGNYQIVTVTGPNTYTINAGANASSSASGGGAVTFEYEIYSGYATNTARFGYGTGTYGSGTYGTPRTSGSGIPVRLRTWSLDQWGEDLVACPSGGPLYWWDRTTGPNARAVIRPDAPSAIQRILVNPENRFLIALGATGLDGVPDPMRVRWPTQETFDDWIPTVTNSAGGKRLDYGSRIVTGLKSRSQNFIWSDTHMYAMEFVGPSLYFGFQPLGTMKIVGPNAAVDANGVIFAMGFDGFYIYDGTMRVMDCDVWTKVFGDPKTGATGDFDRAQAEMVHCSHYATKNEVRWDYRGVGATDCDRCVVYNRTENCWYHHVQSRTAYSNVNEALTGAVTNPFAINAGKLYKQEIGSDEIDGSALTVPAWYLQSYDNHIGGSDAVMLIHSITPNFDRLAGSMEMRLRAKAYPREPSYRDKGPYTITPATLGVDVRQKGSQIALRLSSDGRPGEDFRLGKFQVSASPYGGRTGADTVTLATVTPPVLSGEIVTTDDGSLTWTAATVSGATITGYTLYRKVGAAAFAVLAVLSGTTLAYTDNNLTEEVVYQYYVVAHASNGNDSLASNTVTLQYSAGEPPSLYNINAAVAAAGSSSFQFTYSGAAGVNYADDSPVMIVFVACRTTTNIDIPPTSISFGNVAATQIEYHRVSAVTISGSIHTAIAYIPLRAASPADSIVRVDWSGVGLEGNYAWSVATAINVGVASDNFALNFTDVADVTQIPNFAESDDDIILAFGVHQGGGTVTYTNDLAAAYTQVAAQSTFTTSSVISAGYRVVPSAGTENINSTVTFRVGFGFGLTGT